MRQIYYIVLHCTAGPQTQSLASIQAWWRQLGWRRPGYHRLIMPDGTVHNLMDYSGITNGVQGFNANSIHISYVGGIDGQGRAIDNRTNAQKQAQIALLNEAVKLFPDAVICGHRDFSEDKNRDGVIDPKEWKKTCPSFSVRSWLTEIGFKAANKKYARTNADQVNMRGGRGTSFPVVKVLRAGAPVEVLGGDPEWVLCQSGTTNGWIARRLLVFI